MNNQNKVRVISFFGPPGSGKGTVGHRCAKDLGWSMLSTGDLCRKHMQSLSDLGLELAKYVNQGRLVPDDLITRMVLEWLKEQLSEGKETILLDGFPRNKGQADLFLKALESESGLSNLTFEVVDFDLDEEEIVRRISSRLVCSNRDCQAIYSTIAKKPKEEGICDLCGSSLLRRPDDEEKVVRERLRVFNSFKNTLLDFYKEQNQKLIVFKVPHASIDEVYEAFLSLLG